jgi:hypothetical protein
VQRAEPEMPAGIETNQRLMEGRRNVHLPRWELAVPLSCRRFHQRARWASGSPLSETCGQAVLPESLAGSWSSPAASHHRGRQPVLPKSDRGAEGNPRMAN